MKVAYNYLEKQFAEMDPYFQDLRELVRAGEFTLGPFLEKFEKKVADYLGTKHVIGTNTGTDALILSLKAIGIQSGDEVITVANTFYATVGAIVAVGAKPVFVDCDERYLIDVKQIESKITSKTKALIPVHWGGAPCDMVAILSIAQKYGLKVVEDACPAIGATIGDRFVGTFGHVNAFSFHPLKQLNVWGDGGLIVTNDDAIAIHLKLYRNHGMIDRDHIEIWGVNSRLQPLQAVVASRVLDTMENFIQVRINNAKHLDSGLENLKEFVKIPPRVTNIREVYQLYMVMCQERDGLLKYLIENGIEAKIHYPVPLHLQKPGLALGYRKGDFPNAEKQANTLITLPVHQYITSAQIDYTLSKIRNFYAKKDL